MACHGGERSTVGTKIGSTSRQLATTYVREQLDMLSPSWEGEIYMDVQIGVENVRAKFPSS
jgi:hypothetical protein